MSVSDAKKAAVATVEATRWERSKQKWLDTKEEIKVLKAEYDALDKEIFDKVGVVVHTLQQMVPYLLKMRALLSREGDPNLSELRRKALAKSGLPTWTEYQNKVVKEFQTSISTLKRKLLEGGGDPQKGANGGDTPDPAKTVVPKGRRDVRVPIVEETLASQLCKEGAHLARLVKSSVVSRETLTKQADEYLEKLHALPDGTGAPVVSHSIAPTLTRREAPAQTGTKDKDAVMYGAAQTAAINAANAVEEETIEARFYPFLSFDKARKHNMFLRFLEKQGIKTDAEVQRRGNARRGLPCGEPYRTYEEALAYAHAFAKTLPDLGGFAYGVDIMFVDELDTGHGTLIMGRKMMRLITRSDEPEPSHGG